MDRSVVSLYDAMLDVAVRDLPDPAAPFYTPSALAELKSLKASFQGTPGFQPKFARDLEPCIKAGFFARYVHDPLQFMHPTLDSAKLGIPDPANKPAREKIFKILRPPGGNTNYTGAVSTMPKLFGDSYFIVGDPKRVLAVTQLQLHLFKLWKDGNFLAGGGGASPLFTPEGLDRASLESCVGGAFFPGIECSWLMREKGIYSEPFRIKHGASAGPLTVGPGFFSQQMALPWQADFLDCAKNDPLVTGVFFGWWPAQRPDDVYLNAADAGTQTNMVAWARGVPPPAAPPTPAGQSHFNMVQRWNRLGFVVSGTVAGKTVFFERDRTLP